MENLWIKIVLSVFFGILIYREIIRSASLHSSGRVSVKTKASFFHLLLVGGVVSLFVYAGMQITFIETRDLRPYIPQRFVSPFEKGIIELNGMVIKTNLAPKGELAPLAEQLTQRCHGDVGCEAQKLFDYVTHIPYKTDYTSRSPNDLLSTNWGDCDDKTNLYASLLNERNIDYLLVYVPHHVFMVVHLPNKDHLPLLATSLIVEGKRYYYAETTATGGRLGDFNTQFPSSFEGIYDLKNQREIPMESVSFRMI